MGAMAPASTASTTLTMIGRLTRAADYERLLASPVRQRSAHFAVHHVAGRPSRPIRARPEACVVELSTGCEPGCPEPVDESSLKRWLGCIVPKRHARRAVTRNCLERQIRAAAERYEDQLPRGLWLVRLRQPFAAKDFPSADSGALRGAARAELDRLFTPRSSRAQPDAGGANTP
jgi:ribonuclease P protein component